MVKDSRRLARRMDGMQGSKGNPIPRHSLTHSSILWEYPDSAFQSFSRWPSPPFVTNLITRGQCIERAQRERRPTTLSRCSIRNAGPRNITGELCPSRSNMNTSTSAKRAGPTHLSLPPASAISLYKATCSLRLASFVAALVEGACSRNPPRTGT